MEVKRCNHMLQSNQSVIMLVKVNIWKMWSSHVNVTLYEKIWLTNFAVSVDHGQIAAETL